jgi:hypothetical protein
MRKELKRSGRFNKGITEKGNILGKNLPLPPTSPTIPGKFCDQQKIVL